MDLAKRVTIQFKTPLTAQELERDLGGIGYEQNCEVEYTWIQSVRIDPTHSKEAFRRTNLQKSGGSFSSRGSRAFVSLPFDLQVGYVQNSQDPDDSRYTSLRFFMAPGTSEREVPAPDLEFIDAARKGFCRAHYWREEETTPKDSDL